MNCKISVECDDIVDFYCDVLVLKFAQGFYGADKLVANLLRPDYLGELSPRVDEYVLISSEGKISAENILFVGVPYLYDFDYAQIREFTNYSMQILAKRMPEAVHIAMTIHGIGYGLDEKESFLAQLGGLVDALNANTVPPALQQITIVEKNKKRAIDLEKTLNEHLPSDSLTGRQNQSEKIVASSEIISAGTQSNTKPHIFVAMPFGKEMEDVYRFGIQDPVNAAGFLCERADMTVFNGDVIAHIKYRIETSYMVIADLTGANPNVYLEVGYAWGKEKPTLLIAKSSDELKFDVRSQRCIIYENISDLWKKLQLDLSVLKQSKV